MATSEEARLLLEKKALQRRTVIDVAVAEFMSNPEQDYGRATIARVVECAMLELAKIWREDAASLETSTKHGAKKTRDRLRECGAELAGFASGLGSSPATGMAAAAAPPSQPELPVAPAVPAVAAEAIAAATAPEIRAEATDYTAYLSGETDVMPQIAAVSVPRIVDPEPVRPPRLSWEEVAAMVWHMSAPDHGSFSTINELSECGLKFAFSRLARAGTVKRAVPAWWNVAGTAFHSAVETIERTFIAAGSMPNFNAESAWAAHFRQAITTAETESGVKMDWFLAADKGKENYDFWRVTGPEILSKYMAYWAPRREAGWKILVFPDGRPGLELELTLDVNGWPFVCKIDQVWQRPDDGALVIDDLKTGASRPSSTFQLGGYAHALMAELVLDPATDYAVKSGAIPAIAGAFYKAREGSHDREVADLLKLHPWQELAMRAYAARTMIDNKAYLPQVSDWAGGCGSCPHKLICPARAGDDQP